MRRTYAQAAASYYASLAEDCANRWEQEEDGMAAICPHCDGVIEHGSFRDALSEKEFAITGLCQACQDFVFEPDPEADDPDDDPVAW